MMEATATKTACDICGKPIPHWRKDVVCSTQCWAQSLKRAQPAAPEKAPNRVWRDVKTGAALTGRDDGTFADAPKPPRTCKVCGVSIEHRAPQSRTCSRECRGRVGYPTLPRPADNDAPGIPITSLILPPGVHHVANKEQAVEMFGAGSLAAAALDPPREPYGGPMCPTDDERLADADAEIEKLNEEVAALHHAYDEQTRELNDLRIHLGKVPKATPVEILEAAHFVVRWSAPVPNGTAIVRNGKPGFGTVARQALDAAGYPVLYMENADDVVVMVVKTP